MGRHRPRAGRRRAALTLRKGVLPRGRASPSSSPTSASSCTPPSTTSRGDLVRESHQPELRRALEEGVWSDGEPPLHTFASGAPLQQPDRVRIRAWAEVTGHFTVARPALRRRALAVLRVDARLRREAPGLARAPAAARAAAAHLPHPAAGDRQGQGRVPRARAPGSSCSASCRSRAPRCSPTPSSSAPPRRSARSPREAPASRSSSRRPRCARLRRCSLRALYASASRAAWAPDSGDQHLARADRRASSRPIELREHARDALLEQQALR